MIKQAYFRGLVKRADLTDFAVGEDYKWQRGGAAALAALIGSKALGAGWGTAAALSALAGTTAYNAHNIRNYLTPTKKQTAPEPTQMQRQVRQYALRRFKQRSDAESRAKHPHIAQIMDKADIFSPKNVDAYLARQKEQLITRAIKGGRSVRDFSTRINDMKTAQEAQKKQAIKREKQMSILEGYNKTALFYKKLRDTQPQLLAALRAAGDDKDKIDAAWYRYAGTFGIKPKQALKNFANSDYYAPINNFIAQVKAAYANDLVYSPPALNDYQQGLLIKTPDAFTALSAALAQQQRQRQEQQRQRQLQLQRQQQPTFNFMNL